MDAAGGAVRLRGGDAFVGRERELAFLTGVLSADGAARRPRGVLIEGAAGVGKTRLLDEALTHTPHLKVLRGGADALDRHRSFAAVASALGRPAATHGRAEAWLVALLGDRAARPPAVGPGLRSQLIDAYVAAFRALATDGRVVIVLEDLHWADDGTAAVLGELCEPVPGHDLVVVATRRGAPRPEGMRQLEAALHPGQVEVLELAPLSEDATTALLTDRLGRPPSRELERLVARAGGNPLYISELVAALAEQGSLVAPPGAGTVEVRHTSLPPNLRVTLLHRLSALSDPAVDALRMAALLGTSFAPEDLALALDEPVPVVVARLDEPLRAGWIHGDGGRLTFRHDLVRDALNDDTPEAVRRALHRHLADRLTAAGRPAHEVANHLLLGALVPDPAAAAWLHEAGAAACSREPRVAVELLEAALRLDPTPGPEADARQLDLATARCWAGQVTEGEELLRELLSRPHDPAIDAEAALALARSLILEGATEEALTVLVAAEARADTSVARGPLVAERALCSLLRGELTAAEDAVAQVFDGGPVSDESRCVASSVRCSLLALRGRFADAIAVGEDAVRLSADSAESETVRRPPQLFLGSVLLDADRFDEGWRMLDQGRRLSESLGAVWDLPLVHLVAARGRYLTGDHDDSLTEAETGLALAAEVGTHLLEVWGHAIVARVHLHRGDLEAVRQALAAGEAVVAQVGPQVRGIDWLVWARAGLCELEGDHEVARALLTAVWEGHRERGMRSERRLFGPELVRLHLRAGDEPSAAGVVAAVEELAELAGTVSAAAAAQHVRGLLGRDADRLVAAASLTADTACRTEHVAQALDAADGLVVAGRAAEAAVWFERGASVARDIGMTASGRRADAGLRQLGVRRGARGRRGRPTTGWEALTPTESEVAALAARGLSNPDIGERLYISRRTVQTHLSHVYAKLGIESRVELAGQVARRAT
ncbi:helix-turn-helix transcriptional regulator [Nitriliruptor alkaliphilus]|uniref:helix-turn-helix transcriptional regulator n=1 Tax=Nitriliruptor alkaliphilus TaxID=427918 RepID=UPI0014703CAE|nr:AAA family ATPase [Nitriliruptor alkaliphilus]